MQVTGIAMTPPPSLKEGAPQVTPELLASCLARYSRSNQGIRKIFDSIDWQDPDRSVEKIFKFVDYGHASIGGLTGGIAMAIDGCSMLLAYKIFEIAQLCDGQESSTRYIRLDPQTLPSPDEIGIPAPLASTWQEVMEEAFELYQTIAHDLQKEAEQHPEVVRIPSGADEKVARRLQKNYALDRARYFIPFASKSNAAYVATARVWAETIRRLDALAWPEAQQCASLLREELRHFTPRLIKHSYPDAASQAQAQQEESWCRQYIHQYGVYLDPLADQVFVNVENHLPPFLSHFQKTQEAFQDKANRYSLVGERIRRTLVRFAWNNIALAELRDLNRHRTGTRFTPLYPVGFYLPPEVNHPKISPFLTRLRHLIQALATSSPAKGSHLYAYLLGIQTPFEHSTHLDKLIYEIELRTGLGAHFRYAEHLQAIYKQLLYHMPELAPFIHIGTAEPE